MGLQRQTLQALSAAMANPGAYKQVRDILEFADGPGEKFYVSSVSGVATNDGKSPERPLNNITNALAKCTALQGDTIYLLPGHTETVTAAIAMSTAMVSLIGLGNPGDVVITTATADINLIAVTADNCLIRNIKFTNTATVTSQTEMVDVDASYCVIEDCIFSFAANDKVEGCNFATGKTDNKVLGCTFILPDDGESCILWASTRMEVAYCHFDLSGGEGLALEQLASAGDGCRIHHNTFCADGTVTPMMSWDATPGAGGCVYHNLVFDCAGDTDVFGDDANLDTWFIYNFHGAADGTATAINPSVT